MSSDTATLLAQMLRGFQTPPRSITFYTEFTGKTRAELKQFVRTQINSILEAINLDLIRQLVAETIESIKSSEANLDYVNLSLKSDEPDFVTVQKTLASIYYNLSVCQNQREQVQHYLLVIKNAESYLKIFSKSLEQFFLDEEEVAPGAYTHLSERKRAFESLIVDLEGFLQTLVQFRQDLTGIIDNVISPRNQLLLRAESSLRLLSKFSEQDSKVDMVQSRNKTRSPAEFLENSGFTIHSEEKR